MNIYNIRTASLLWNLRLFGLNSYVATMFLTSIALSFLPSNHTCLCCSVNLRMYSSTALSQWLGCFNALVFMHFLGSVPLRCCRSWGSRNDCAVVHLLDLRVLRLCENYVEIPDFESLIRRGDSGLGRLRLRFFFALAVLRLYSLLRDLAALVPFASWTSPESEGSMGH